jgi:hypothetical protein
MVFRSYWWRTRFGRRSGFYPRTSGGLKSHKPKRLKNGDCGPESDLILSDGSDPGDWRLPTMKELCSLIDLSNKNPALPRRHMFSEVPPGYHWSSTRLAYHSGLAWVVYPEVDISCYDDVKHSAGHVLSVWGPKD